MPLSANTCAIDLLTPGTLANVRLKLPYKTSIASVCLPGTIWEKIDAVSNAGFDSIEIMTPDLNEGTAEQLYSYCTQKNLTISILQPFRDLEGYEEAAFREKLAQFEEFLGQCKQLHCDTVLLCANCDPDALGDHDILVPQLREAAKLAQSYGIRIAYENLSWALHNSKLASLVDVIIEVDEPNFGICMDLFHINIHHSSLDEFDRVQDKLFFVQLCDSPHLTDIGIIDHARNYRLFPLQGDYANVLEAMDKIAAAGYTGPLSLEVFNRLYKEFPGLCSSTADDALRSLVFVQETWTKSATFPSVHLTGVKIAEESMISKDISQGRRSHNILDIAFTCPSQTDLENIRSRASCLGYTEMVSRMDIRVGAPQEKEAVVAVPSRLLFNRLVLVLKSVFGFRPLHEHKLSLVNEFNLPTQTAFGSGDVVVVLSIAE